jgi:hypothetical protein
MRNARSSDTRSFGSERQDNDSEACLKVESPSSQLTSLYLSVIHLDWILFGVNGWSRLALAVDPLIFLVARSGS